MIFLGVDGGGTKTHALAVDEHGTVIGTGVSGESNYQVIGLPQAAANLADATRQALGGRRADKAVYCLAGCDTDLDLFRLTACIAEMKISDDVSCYNDAFAPLRAGTRHPFGVAVICGTGFNACGVAPDGRQARLHSLGPLTGDWGGGYAFGEGMFAAVFRADERRGPPTLMKDMLLSALRVSDLDALAYKLIDNQIDRAEIAALSPLVFEAAEQGDAAARALILRQVDEIVVAARAMMAQLDMDDLALDVVLSGGVFKGVGSLLIDQVTLQLSASHPKAAVTRLTASPVIGSVLLAFDARGYPAPTIRDAL